MWDFIRYFRARLTEPHDGDTFRVMADTGFDGRAEPRLRLLGVSAPELDETGGWDTTRCIQEWFDQAQAAQPGRKWPLYIITEQTKADEPEQKRTFVRFLATVWRYDQRPTGPTPGQSLNEYVNAYLAQHPDWPKGE